MEKSEGYPSLTSLVTRDDFGGLTRSVVIRISNDFVAFVAVNLDRFFTSGGTGDFDERFLQGGFQFSGDIFVVERNRDGVVHDARGHKQNARFGPDGARTTEVGGPFGFVVTTEVGITDGDVASTRRQVSSRLAVTGGRLLEVGQIGDAFVEVVEQPDRRIDVSGSGRGRGVAPHGTVHIVPGQGRSGIDFVQQGLSVIADTG